MGVKINFGNITYLVLNIYCICDYGSSESLLIYKSIMADLSNICELEYFNELIILGDMNADPARGRFFKEFQNFVETHSLHMADISTLPSSSYTYISSNSTCSTSWLDHVVSSRKDLTKNQQIFYVHAFYDHLPIYFDLNIPHSLNFQKSYRPSLSQFMSISWDKATDEMKNLYQKDLDDLILYLYDDVLTCNEPNCSSSAHIYSLEALYSNLCECISVISEYNLPIYKNNGKEHRVIGWNRYCKDFYTTAREDFLKWHQGGRIRSGELFEKMKASRTNFKNAIKFCRINEDLIRKENLLMKFNSRNKSSFWKEVKQLNGTTSKIISYIDGKSDVDDIMGIFNDKFSKILNDPVCHLVDPPPVQSKNVEYNIPLISFMIYISQSTK